MRLERSEVILLLVILACVVPLSLFVADWSGLLLLYISIGLILFVKDIQKNWKMLALIWVALTVRHAISVVNAYYTIVIGADVDAVTFHENAVLMAHSIQPSWFGEFGSADAGSNAYTQLLATFYRIFGDSKFLGQELSVLAFALTVVVFIKMVRELNLQRYLAGLLLIFLVLPSMVIFTSITLRESYQILCFLATICWTICLRHRPNTYNAAIIVLAASGLAIFHNGMVIYSLFLTCLSLFWGFNFSLTKLRGKNLIMKVMGPFLIIGIAFAWISFAGNFGGATRALMEGEGVIYLGGYRDKTSTSFDRATYGGKLDTSSVTAFVPSASEVFLMYMFAPLPWQISKPVDVYAAFEGLLRLLLIFQALMTWYRMRGERRSQWGYLLICYFSLEFLWAVGTSNWGTAIRHHTVAYGILVVIGGPGLFRLVSKPFRRKRSRRSRFGLGGGRRRLIGEMG